MKFKQFYLGCLAHASYYIGSEGEAAIIDPQRDVEQYLEEAAANNQEIKYVIETHSHADFVSGHVELADRTGAEIIFGERAKTEFPTRKVKDGETIRLGNIELQFMETPGHTPEGITIVAEDLDSPQAPIKIFTGDTLFIGDVGRPDLIGSKGFTAEEMASMLYDSIHEKILPMPDSTEVYPAHGAGSLCGKSLSKETWSTLGEQRKSNYALQPMSREAFIAQVAENQPEVPAYFPLSASQNLKGSVSLSTLSKPLELDVDSVSDFDGVVVDVREREKYGEAHIPNAVNIGLGGQFASWAGTLIPIGTSIAIAADSQDQVDEALMRLARVGFETVNGYVLMSGYEGETKQIKQISVNDVDAMPAAEIQFVDVRRVQEFTNGHARNTINLPLDRLSNEVEKLDPKKPTYVICQSGYRSSVGTGILENAGFEEVYNVTGGTNAWIDGGLEVEVSATSCANS